jgi:hypothetical protein
MGFKSLFKVRQPGHGEAFEARVKSAIASGKSRSFPKVDNSQNSGGRKAVK